MKPIHLSKVDPLSGLERVFEMSVSTDLFGWHIVLSRWGRPGRLRAERSEPFQTTGEARARLAELTLVRVQRGYGPPTSRERLRPRYRLGVGSISWRQSQAIARALYCSVAAEGPDPSQLELRLPEPSGEPWARQLIEQFYARPSPAERLYQPSFQLTLARLFRYRELSEDLTTNDKVIRFVPRSVQAFTAYSLDTFFANDQKTRPAVVRLSASGIETVAQLLEQTAPRLERDVGLTRDAVVRLRIGLLNVGLDLGMRVPPSKKSA